MVVAISAASALTFVVANRQQMPHNQREFQSSLTVLPDQVRVHGNLVFATGQLARTGEKTNINFRVKTRTEQHFWQKLTHPVTVAIRGKQRPIMLATNENQFDARQYYRSQRVNSEVRAEEVRVVQMVKPHTLSDKCHVLRALAHCYFQRLPPPLSQYADQLIIGWQGGQTDWRAAVRRLGIIHLFCLSGMHVVILCELLRRGLIYCRWTRETIDLVLATILPAYLILGGGAASLVRAVVMAECRLLSRWLKVCGIDGWAWSLMIGCWLEPLVLTSLGGQLSYLLSLLLYLLEGGEFFRSLLLNLTGLPLILNCVYEVHILSFIMSYLVSPIFSVLLFPGTILSVLTYPWSRVPALWFKEFLVGMHRILIICAQMPGMIHFGKPPAWAVWLLLVMSLVIIDQPTDRRSYVRLLATYLAIFGLIHFPLTGEVAFVDVGQGDSIIIRTPFNRHVLMIDTGGRLNFRQPHWAHVQSRLQAEKTSINYLKSKGVSHLDAVLLSHSDADHIGDLPAVLTELKVKRIYVPVGMEKLAKFQRKLPAGTTAEVIPTKKGDWCERTLLTLHPQQSGQGKNGDSLTLLGNFGGQSFLFTGDLDQQGERQVVHCFPNLRVDVLKLGHHGSRTASGTGFLRTIRPSIGIVSAGRFNRYGHPHTVTIKRLTSLGIQSWSTQQYGMIRYQYFGKKGHWLTTLRGEELGWMLPPYRNS